MPDSKKTDMSEEERIKAWREERARIAEADKAERLRQKAKGQAAAAEEKKHEEKVAALTLLSSAKVQAVPESATGPNSEDDVEPSVTQTPASSLTPSAPLRAPSLGNWALFVVMVVAPVLLTAFYLFAIATPLFEARSVVAITKSAENNNSARTGLLGGTRAPSNLEEVFRAHAYVESQAMMDALEADFGLVTTYSSSEIDPLQRLRSIPLLSVSKIEQFDRFVESSVDIQSGLLTLFVRAPSQEQAISISEAVLLKAEARVGSLGQQVFDKRQAHAAEVRKAAEQQVADAQADLVALQIKYQEVDPKNRVESIYSTIKDLEAEAQKLRGDVQRAQIAGIGDSLQTRQTEELEARIRDQIAQERSRLVTPEGDASGSLNTFLMEYELATLEVDLAREAVKTALKAEADAGQEAALNRSLLQVVVPPRTAQAATHPQIPGTLALVFLVALTAFAAIAMFRSSRV